MTIIKATLLSKMQPGSEEWNRYLERHLEQKSRQTGSTIQQVDDENIPAIATAQAAADAAQVTADAAQVQTDILDDINTLGVATTDGEFIVATGAGAFAYETGATARSSMGAQTQSSVLDDFNDLGVSASDGEFIVATGAGTFAYETTATARTSMGAQAQGDVLDDLNTLGAPTADGEFIVATGAGALAYETGATARTSLGLGSLAVLNVSAAVYTPANDATDRTWDANAAVAGTGVDVADAGPVNVALLSDHDALVAVVQELSDVVATLITDLQAAGIIQ